ncbi:IclR family transcriptional regulator [Variovorax sp. RTB1]|jgi:DNA-binding IclR family transcriptional regulator|uniref:IclR family transcriptional regulator n=1 Tax=Variovorax sp. RTB1 TaxID=3048631 RepID=UPI002B233425|nr:IclR family transcriptional regulator [Variovorax sp. RTB1]MEB0114530.1 IclR family transcriptional regulator [Variovorax sp. RTB1]
MQTKTKGAQTVFRALTLLQHVARLHPQGVTIGALADEATLDRATAYRLVSSLVEAGFVERDARKVYRLGLQAMQLGLAAMNQAPLLEACRPVMQRLARRTEDTVFLVVRNGDYAHCLHCEEGAFPVKAMVLQIGGMRVLGIGSAGMTLLSRLEDDQIESLYARHRDEFEPGGPTLPQLKRHVAQTRKQGCAMTDGLVTEGVGGVGMSFEITSGGHAAISIAAISSRVPAERKRWIAQLISEEVRSAGFNPTA